MRLTFKVHCDDYHSRMSVLVDDVPQALERLELEHSQGYDIGEVELEGRPFYCRRCAARGRTTPCEFHAQAREGLCITHRHECEYNEDWRSYKGD